MDVHFDNPELQAKVDQLTVCGEWFSGTGRSAEVIQGQRGPRVMAATLRKQEAFHGD